MVRARRRGTAEVTGTGPETGAFRGTPDDAEVAARSLLDTEAFGILYDRYFDQIYRHVYRKLGDIQVAEDLTAEVFFKALKGIETYRPDTGPFSTWLYRIATNTVIDHTRARRPVFALDTAVDEPDRSASVDEQAISRVEAAEVWRAVDALPEAQRIAVILRHGNDLPIAEIAERMARTEGAVKLLLNRGLTTVRTHLGAGSSGTGTATSAKGTATSAKGTATSGRGTATSGTGTATSGTEVTE